MKHGRLQCKDIPDLPVLAFLRDLPPWEGTNLKMTGTWFDFEPRPVSCVLRAMPAGTPDQLGLAKMRMLMKRRLVDGCGCGCRGDFELTPAGLLRLANEER